MENQTHFDLSRALIAWEKELAAQPGISAEDVRELRSHLVDCFRAGQRTGLSEGDAFAGAVRQVGAADRIGAEFEKVNPLRSWRHRVFLMALAGMLIWAWARAIDALMLGGQVFWDLSAPWGFAAWVLLNGVLPLSVLILLVNGRAAGWLGGIAWLFKSRWVLLAAGVTCAVGFSCASAWALWHHPNPQIIFGPGGREQTSLGALVWQYLSRVAEWPGPLLALLLWLAPCGRATLSTAVAKSRSNPAPNREVVFWISISVVVVSCFHALSGALFPFWSKLGFWLFSSDEARYRIFIAVARWLPNLVLCLLAISAVRGQLGHLAETIALRVGTRPRIVTTGILLVLLSNVACGLAGSILFSSFGGLWLISEMFWPAILIGFIAWLAPSVTRGSARQGAGPGPSPA